MYRSSPLESTAKSPRASAANAVRSFRAWGSDTPAAAATSDATTRLEGICSTAAMTASDGSCSHRSAADRCSIGTRDVGRDVARQTGGNEDPIDGPLPGHEDHGSTVAGGRDTIATLGENPPTT